MGTCLQPPKPARLPDCKRRRCLIVHLLQLVHCLLQAGVLALQSRALQFKKACQLCPRQRRQVSMGSRLTHPCNGCLYGSLLALLDPGRGAVSMHRKSAGACLAKEAGGQQHLRAESRLVRLLRCRRSSSRLLCASELSNLEP